MHTKRTSVMLFWLGIFAFGAALLSEDSRASINQTQSAPKKIVFKNTSMGEMRDEDGVHLGFTNFTASDGNTLTKSY